MVLLCSGILLFFLTGIVTLFVPARTKGSVLSLGFAVAQIFLLPQAFSVLLSGRTLETSCVFSEPIGNAPLRLDPLAAFFLFIISVGGLLAALYSMGYMKMYEREKKNLSVYYFFLAVLVSSMAMVVIVQNALLFLLVWEVMSLASFFLVSFEQKKEEVRKTGIYYLVAMQVSAAFLMTAFAWTSAITGSLDFQSFGVVLESANATATLLGILFFLGFGIKAGFVPLHTWLPRAHPAAPSGVSALMSGVMIKTGIYGILRIVLLGGLQTKQLAYGVLFVALMTGLYGIAHAIAQKDLKRLLAFSSIENIGIIGIGVGLGLLGRVYHNPAVALLGFLGAFLHLFNHFTFKSILFYSAGIVYQETHTRNIEQLGGLTKYLPLTSLLFFVASLAISGMPFFSGFVSEFLLYMGIVKSISPGNLAVSVVALVALAGLTLIGGMALLCFTKAYGIAFLGNSRSQYHELSERGILFQLIPMLFLACISIAVGLFPYLLVPMFISLVQGYVPTADDMMFSNAEMLLKQLSIALAVFLLILVGVIAFRNFLLKKKRVEIFKTWDCGYQLNSSRLQYTGSSFVQFFLDLISQFIPQKKVLTQEQNYFPSAMTFESYTHDFSERAIIRPLLQFLDAMLARFSWIQSGKLQQYILYGLLFLVVLLVWIWSTL